MSLSETENKKRKIDELVKQLLHYDSSMTAASLFQALKNLEIADKVSHCYVWIVRWKTWAFRFMCLLKGAVSILWLCGSSPDCCMT
jgi:hypothetical protein